MEKILDEINRRIDAGLEKAHKAITDHEDNRTASTTLAVVAELTDLKKWIKEH